MIRVLTNIVTIVMLLWSYSRHLLQIAWLPWPGKKNSKVRNLSLYPRLLLILQTLPSTLEHNLENTKGADALIGMIHQRVSRYMNDKASTKGNYINVSHLGEFVGTIINYALHILDSLSLNTWIIDIGASNHMCTKLKLLTDQFKKMLPLFICLMDQHN